MAQRAVVALTDLRWFEFLRSRTVDGKLDEVNFWRPKAQVNFRALAPGEPFFFRLMEGINSIVGYGFFAHATRLPIRLAWDAFAERNGDPTFEAFLSRIAAIRHETPLETALGSRPLTCLILRNVRFLPAEQWIRWEESRGFSKGNMTYKSYELASPDGAVLTGVLQNGNPPEFTPIFELISGDSRILAERLVAARDGQGAFRVRVLDAYDRRCAITGEHALPVLDAAHIQPYFGPMSNHIQNGLSLRADIHRLYDAGYVTVTPGYRFQVSSRLKDDFDNGQAYYQIDGRPLSVVPADPRKRPSLQALEWHAANVFR